jgi:uncharacterized protein (UPF0335 family)
MKMDNSELKSFVERIERLADDKKAIGDDIKDIFTEMKGRGYDVKIVREILKIRKIDRATRDEMETILDTYKAALGL